MTATAPSIDLTPLHATGGQVYAYLVPADDFDKLQTELTQLRAQVTRLQRQKDGYVAQLHEAYTTPIPAFPTDEEFEKGLANANVVKELIAELEGR